MQTFASILPRPETATSSDARQNGHCADSAGPLAPRHNFDVSLAIKYRNAEDSINHGTSCLLPNSHASWLAIRTVRVNGRRKLFASITRALIRYGMPAIDFSHGVFDADIEESRRRGFRHPILERENDLRIFAKMTARMRKLAVEPHGQNRQALDNVQLSFSRAFPTPYLSFPNRLIDQVCWTALRAIPQNGTDGLGQLSDPVLENPETRAPNHYPLHASSAGDAIEPAWSVHPLISFCKRFRRALDAGIPLAATGPMTYCGTVDRSNGPRLLQNVPKDMSGHRIRAHSGGGERVVYLPRNAHITVRLGQDLPGGEIWAQALPISAQGHSQCRDDMVAICGGKPRLAYLEWLWLRHQVIENPDRPAEALLPAHLSCLATREVSPINLYWDLVPCERYIVSELEVALLPPLQVTGNHPLRWKLPGDVDMNVAVNASAYRNLSKSHRRRIHSFRRTD